MSNLFDYRNVLSPRMPIRHYTVLSGTTVAEGDPVKIDATTGHVELVAADGQAILGWALGAQTGTAAGKTVPVLLAMPGVQVHMPIVSGTTWAATLAGINCAVAGSTGAFTANLATAGLSSGDLLKAVQVGKTTSYAWMTVIPTCSEAFNKEPT